MRRLEWIQNRVSRVGRLYIPLVKGVSRFWGDSARLRRHEWKGRNVPDTCSCHRVAQWGDGANSRSLRLTIWSRSANVWFRVEEVLFRWLYPDAN